MPEETPEERAQRRKRLQFLCNSKDYEAVRCRLFVSGLDTNRVQKPELIALFSPHGRVYDLSIHKGYAFVQYDNLESSLSAVGKLNTSKFMGSQLLVKLAEKGRKAEVAEKEVCRFFCQGSCMRGKNCNYLHVNPNKSTRDVIGYPGTTSSGLASRRDPETRREPDSRRELDSRREPEPRRELDRGRDSGRFASRENNGPVSLPPPIRDSSRHERGSERERRDLDRTPVMLPPSDRPAKRPLPADFDDLGRRPRPSDHGDGYGAVSDRPSRSAAPPTSEIRRPILESPHRPAPERRSIGHSPATESPRQEAPPVDLRPPYDCVVIAGNEAQRGYCDMIEKRLTEFGMLTNVQVVGGEHVLKRAVEEASRHTVPYTICVTANNEQHKSLTLNILHGVAQEHRNMPLEDAMPFLSRNFDNFVEMMKQKISAVNEWLAPEKKVAYYLHLLGDGRRLTLKEVAEVDKYVSSVLARLKTTQAATGPMMAGPREDLNERGGSSRGLMDIPRSSQRHSMERGLDSQLGLRGQLLPEPSREPTRESAFGRSRESDFGSARGGMSDNFRTRTQDLPSDMRSNGLFGNASALSATRPPGPGLLENPAVKRALDELISSRSSGGRENHGGRGFAY